jgi:hypothetical protein
VNLIVFGVALEAFKLNSLEILSSEKITEVLRVASGVFQRLQESFRGFRSLSEASGVF